jgi:hypothetical protein
MTGLDISAPLPAATRLKGLRGQINDIRYLVRRPDCVRHLTVISDGLGRIVRLRVSTNAIKSVDHNGGLDAFL